jgi:hypothetical protein
VRLEGLGKLKKNIDLIGIRTRDLPACSIVPQPTTLPRVPQYTPMYRVLACIHSCDWLTSLVRPYMTMQYIFLIDLEKIGEQRWMKILQKG